MRLRPFRFLFRFGIFVIVVLLISAFAAWLFMAVGVDNLSGVRSFIDDFWLKASLLRWIVLAMLIWYLPRWYLKQEGKHQRLQEAWAAELADAELHDAEWETIRELRNQVAVHQRLEDNFRSMHVHRYWIGLMLVAIEVVFVQLPHWL